ncbi:MAG: hypothetical protein MJA30_25305 [Cytophagales bacterium]|nr:hypothetical protein [Cytophagales bacterium]
MTKATSPGQTTTVHTPFIDEGNESRTDHYGAHPTAKSMPIMRAAHTWHGIPIRITSITFPTT